MEIYDHKISRMRNDHSVWKRKEMLICMISLLILCCSGAPVHAGSFADCEIPAVCRIEGGTPDGSCPDFKYTLKAVDEGSPMPYGSRNGEKTIHMTGSGKLRFGRISFDHPDVFYYTLLETTDYENGTGRDDREYHAALMADTDGEVKMVIMSDPGGKTDKVEFTSYRVGNAPKTGDAQGSMIAALLILIVIAVIGIRRVLRLRQVQEGYTESVPFHSDLRMILIACIAVLMAGSCSCRDEAFADVSVTHDHSDLPVNNVAIGPLDFSTAEFTALDSRIKMGNYQYYLEKETVTYPSVYWVSSTAPKFGSADATETTDAKLGSNTIAGDIFRFRFSGAATLSDGSTADVLMVFSDLYFGLSKNVNGTSGSKYYFPLIRLAADGTGRYCNSSIGTSTKNSGRIKGVRSATRIKTTITIVKSGTDEPIADLDYILSFRDLDVKDNTSATGSSVDRYAKHYSEGIGLISGFSEPVWLSENSMVRQDTWDGVTKLRGTGSSDGGKESGADISVKSSGFSYYWYGSFSIATSNSNPGGAMGTLFGCSPVVNVHAASGAGGSIEKDGETEYPVNSVTTYSYTPSQGYLVRGLTVDGSAVSFSRTGGTYTFEKLTETSEDDYDHTIEVSFHKPGDIRIEKNVKGPLGDVTKRFRFMVMLSGLEESHVFELSQDSTGTFTGTDGEGVRLTSRTFRSSSGGEAVLELELKDDQFVRIREITGGAHYSVSENASDHAPSYRISGDGQSPVITKAEGTGTVSRGLGTEPERVDENDGLVTIRFNNERGMAAPTGIRTDSGPYMTGLVIFSALIVIAAAGIRKKD